MVTHQVLTPCQLPHLKRGLGDKKLETKDFKIPSFPVGEMGLGSDPGAALKILKCGYSALRITRACQAASFKRNKRGYKNPESFYRALRASRKQRQSREGASGLADGSGRPEGSGSGPVETGAAAARAVCEVEVLSEPRNADGAPTVCTALESGGLRAGMLTDFLSESTWTPGQWESVRGVSGETRDPGLGGMGMGQDVGGAECTRGPAVPHPRPSFCLWLVSLSPCFLCSGFLSV